MRDEVAVRPLLVLLDDVLRGAWTPTSGRAGARRSTSCCRPPASATRWGCAGCGGCCGVRSSRPAASAPATSCWPRCCSTRARGRAGPDATPARRLATARGCRAGGGAGRVGADGPHVGAGGHGGDGAVGDLGVPRRRRPLASARAARGRGAASAPTATSTPWWRCSTRRRAFVDRLPASGPDAFLEHLLRPGRAGRHPRRPAPRGRRRSRCSTPAAAAGREWRFVAVAGVQEGVWPDLRLRGSLLGSEELVAVGDRPRALVPRGPDGGALRRDAAVPRRRLAGPGAAARHRRAQRGRPAVGLPRPRRPAAGR